jgi:hypothetical protein
VRSVTKKLNKRTKPGDWFSIPLEDSKSALLHVVAGIVPIFFGYFFAPVPLSQLPHLKPNKSLLACRFSDLFIVKKRWEFIQNLPVDESIWIVPDFVRKDTVSGQVSLVTYSSDDLSVELSQRMVATDEHDGPADGLFGAGLVEKKLLQLIR